MATFHTPTSTLISVVTERPAAVGEASIYVYGTVTATGITGVPGAVPTQATSYTSVGLSKMIWRGQSMNAGAYLGAITWGLLLAVFLKAIVNVLKHKNRTNLTWLPFIGTLFASATVSMCGFASFNQQAWLDQRNRYDTPMAFLEAERHAPTYVMATVASLIVQLLSQGFLVYRCHAIFNKRLVTIPLLVWAFATFVMGSAFSAKLSLMDAFPSELQTPFVTLGMSFNIVVSALLSVAVVRFSRRVPTSFPDHVRRKFVRVDAILVESASFLGIMSLIYLSLSSANVTSTKLFTPFMVQLEALFPLLIVIRLVQGWGWDSEVINRSPTDYDRFYARDMLHIDNASISGATVVGKISLDEKAEKIV
ncbi:hypothetical protein BXZ70DRAFT_1063825 [Cristinia sonorae]|uniref:Uncharacterized protein n=1 Tax=Cristinia sonorae TaxID=1940300 RepID=A0A8K0XR40_9AGAR|nr:hypothetical protein BXZ70DRAFT_1063825 [Cristinia sonorae]